MLLKIAITSILIFSIFNANAQNSFGNKETTWSADAFDYWFTDVSEQNLPYGISEAVLFSSSTRLGQLLFTKSGITILNPRRLTEEHQDLSKIEEGGENKIYDDLNPLKYEFLFINSSQDAELIGSLKCSHYSVFGRTKLSNYNNLVYRGIYPNIDIIFSLPETGGLKYDIIVHPGGNIEDVQIMHKDSKLDIKKEGNLNIKTEGYLLTDKAPTAFDSDDIPVAVSFELKNNLVSFETEPYDKSKTLIIDPVIDFSPDSSFVSGSGTFYPLEPMFRNINFDMSGNLYCSVDRFWNFGNFFNYRKYSPNGVLLWSNNTGIAYIKISDVTVNPQTGTSYAVTGDLVSIDSNGLTIASVNNVYSELSVRYDPCLDTVVMGLGGCNPGPIPVDNEVAVFSPNLLTGVSNNINLLPCLFYQQGSSALTLDPEGGDAYFVMNTATIGPGLIYKMNYGQVGVSPSLTWQNLSLSSAYPRGASSDVLTCGRNYLYYFDGSAIEKRNKNTGALLNTLTINVNSPILLSADVFNAAVNSFVNVSPHGIDLDLCGNVYVGQSQAVKVYDSNLNFLTQYLTTSLDTILDIQIHEDQLAVGGFNYLEVFTLPYFSGTNNNITLSTTPDTCALCIGSAAIDTTSFPCGDLDSLDILWSNGQNTPAISGLCEGWYSVTISGGCFSQQFTDSVFVSNTATLCGVNISIPDDTICVGECVDLVAATIGSFTAPVTYAWNNGIIATDSVVNVCPTATTTYEVIGTDSTGLADTAIVTITVVAPPVINLGNDTAICAAPFTLDAGNIGASFSWQDGSNTQLFSVDSSGVFSVTVDNGVCINTDSIVINYDPAIVNLGPDIITCQPDTVVFDAGVLFVSYLWGDNSTDQTLNALNTGMYSVEVTNSSGCTALDTTEIIAGSLALNLGSDTVICQGQSLLVNAQTQASGVDYLWSTGSTNPTLTLTDAGVYWVEVSSGICLQRDSIEVQEQIVTAAFEGLNESGCSPVTIDFNSTSVVSIGSITSWDWNFGNGMNSNVENPNQTYLNEEGITYPIQLIVTSDLGCTDDTTVFMQINAYPQVVAEFSYFPNTVLFGEDIYFENLSTNATSWQWDFGDGVNSIEESPAHSYLTIGTYSIILIASNEFGCNDTISYQLEVSSETLLFVPNTFTPDGDEFNQNWVVQISEIDIYDFSITLFNRWGELIWESFDPEVGWDGTINGAAVQDGVYTWKIEVGTKFTGKREIFTGHVNVIR
jgi:gliding motility-associated-like protein